MGPQLILFLELYFCNLGRLLHCILWVLEKSFVLCHPMHLKRVYILSFYHPSHIRGLVGVVRVGVGVAVATNFVRKSSVCLPWRRSSSSS